MASTQAQVRLVVLLLILPATGCIAGHNGPKSRGEKEHTTMISPEQARDALLKLIEKSRTTELPVLQREADVIRNSPVKNVSGSFFSIGHWGIDQEEQTFVVTFHDLPFLLQYSGKFEQGASGMWNAVITGTQQTPVKVGK